MKLLLAGIANIPFIRAAPIRFLPAIMLVGDEGMPPDSPTLWIYLAVAVALVLLGGAFAGLTIALMGQVMFIDHLPARRKKLMWHDPRMKSIYKLSGTLERVPNANTRQRCFDSSNEASIGFW